MARKRMFTMQIVDSDAFLDMPLSSQCLYFHLNMRADDDGFVSNPNRILSYVGASPDDLKLLIAKRFVLVFDTGVIVIKHWRMHNCIQSDRYTPTQYIENKKQLYEKENKAYTLNENEGIPLLDNCINEEGKQAKVETMKDMFAKLETNYQFEPNLAEKIKDWLVYKSERKEPYKCQGMKALLTQISKNADIYGAEAMCDLIDKSMASNWVGIAWNSLADGRKKDGKQNVYEEWRNA